MKEQHFSIAQKVMILYVQKLSLSCLLWQQNGFSKNWREISESLVCARAFRNFEFYGMVSVNMTALTKNVNVKCFLPTNRLISFQMEPCIIVLDKLQKLRSGKNAAISCGGRSLSVHDSLNRMICTFSLARSMQVTNQKQVKQSETMNVRINWICCQYFFVSITK